MSDAILRRNMEMANGFYLKRKFNGICSMHTQTVVTGRLNGPVF